MYTKPLRFSAGPKPREIEGVARGQHLAQNLRRIFQIRLPKVVNHRIRDNAQEEKWPTKFTLMLTLTKVWCKYVALSMQILHIFY